jgi:hypothetical protein
MKGKSCEELSTGILRMFSHGKTYYLVVFHFCV